MKRFAPRKFALLSLALLTPHVAALYATPAADQIITFKLEQYSGREDLDAMITAALPAAEAGDADAQFVSAVCYDLGLGVRMDYERAVHWLGLATAQQQALALAYSTWRTASGYGAEVEFIGVDANRVRAALQTGYLPNCTTPLPSALRNWLTTEEGACRPRFKRLLITLTERAESGDVIAQSNLSAIFMNSHWGMKDNDMHLYWLRRAAKSGDIPAMELLAVYYQYGLGVTADLEQAKAYRRAAAETGDVGAQYRFAESLQGSDRSEADNQEAAKWYLAAAKQGDPASRDALIIMLRQGMPGVPVNFTQARELALVGMFEGQAAAASHYGDLLYLGEGGKRSVPDAVEAYTKATELGAVRSINVLGWIYANGELGTGPDKAKAFMWYNKGAGLGELTCLRELGKLYEDGIGTQKSPELAFASFEQAARGGDTWSQNHIGWMLREGIGVGVDYEEALNWFQVAVKGGEEFAVLNIADLYIEGLGVSKDPRKAFDLLVGYFRTNDHAWGLTVFEKLLALPADQRVAFQDSLFALAENPNWGENPWPLSDFCYRALNMIEGDESEELRDLVLHNLSQAGDSTSIKRISSRFLYGNRVPYDSERARRLLESLDDKSLKDLYLAHFTLVTASDEALVVTAVQTLERACIAGSKEARSLLAEAYRNGLGVEIDLDRSSYIASGGSPERLQYPSTPEGERYKKEVSAMLEKKPSSSTIRRKLKALLKDGGDSQPQCIFHYEPHYPQPLRESSVTGQALISFIVKEDGSVANVSALSATHPLFAQEAIRSVKKWIFLPGCKDGKTVNIHMNVPIIFSITDTN